MRLARKEPTLKTITLRNIPPELARKLEQKARTKGVSFSKITLEILENAMGLSRGKRRVRHHDLDSLAGTWSKQEATTFEASLREQRRVDPDLWM